MRVLVAMSGGVDSSVAAALLLDRGHRVVGATMKLWGGPSDSGCCSVADVEDARRVCRQLGIDHHVFNFSADFERDVVGPYVSEHLRGRTPNPCIECNRHLKFDRFLERALRLGFDAVATGHHARITEGRLRRGRDEAKDQSYVLAVLGPAQLARVVLPIGDMDKSEVRDRARALGLGTADKPDSLDVCFITASAGRRAFIDGRADLHPGVLVDSGTGEEVGTVPAVELVTVGQRRGLGAGGRSVGSPARRFALEVDVARRRVLVGAEEELLIDRVPIGPPTWTGRPVPPGTRVEVQVSAHGAAHPGVVHEGVVVLDAPVRRVAPGQTVAFYAGDAVLGAATAETAGGA